MPKHSVGTHRLTMEGDGRSVQKKPCCCLRLGSNLCLFIFGLFLLISGVVLRSVIDQIFKDKIDENLVLRPGSPTYKPWAEPTMPVPNKYYFFNVVNPDEVVKDGAKPVLEEKGPYTLLSYQKKFNITWQDKDGTVSYDEKSWFIYDSASSCESCDLYNDKITTVNMPLMVVVEMLKKYPDFFHWKRLVGGILRRYKETLFMTRKVNDLIWGYEDPLLVEINKLRNETVAALPALNNFFPNVTSKIFLLQNNTLQGRTVVYTGVKNIEDIQKWKSWKGKNNFDMYKTKYANMLNGTDGRQFAPDVKKNDRIYLILIQLCRSVYLTYDQELKDQDIDVYRFVIPQEVLLNGTVDPDNAAFYDYGLLPTGLLDSRKCQGSGSSAPVFISLPHFYLGDPRLVDAVVGLKPNKEKHQFSFDVEPILGAIMTNAIRLQVNVLIEAERDISQTGSTPSAYVPVMWFEVEMSLDSDTAALFRNDIILPMEIFHDVEIAMICLGSVLMLMTMIIFCCVRKRKNRTAICCCSENNEEKSPLLINSGQER
ncbi:lysosome membrane protein 2-like [Dendronephthya gigantea]|uniref:lysosome membrane protein 2-like n=1 Tax=Dendronephthya gigantea TaxID=151771 RepID=UPI00106D343E|nr:lysosome membrane protein 2-like [Dendronephthya gigantea]